MQIVEDAQPYKVGHESNSLAILDNLDIIDKHHELLAVAASVEIPYYGSPKGVETVDSWGWGCCRRWHGSDVGGHLAFPT